MTIRQRLTFRFTGLVSSILLLAFVSIYTFCWYFISSDFYRRLDQRVSMVGDILVRHGLHKSLIQQVSHSGKGQRPNQKLIVFDNRNRVVLETNEGLSLTIPVSVLTTIRQDERVDFRQEGYYLSGSHFTTAAGQLIVVASDENTYGDAFLRRLLWALLGLLLLIVGITAFSGWFFAGDSLRPMQQIDQVVNAIFPHNQDERLRINKEDDEINRLSRTINRLLDRVAESFRLQRLFVANVSHELKNPLTQISSQLEVSLLNQRDPDSYRRTIRSVLDDVGKLTTLTHELLQLSKINQDVASDLLTDTVRIDELVWDVRDQVMSLHSQYTVSVELGVLPDEASQLAMQGNKPLLETALKNLTENACKFSGDGRALVRMQFGQAVTRIQIANAGEPIPADDLPYIFEPFYRSRRTTEVRGYGIGLSLVRRIVQLHGGQISVTSTINQPTIFTIDLPRS